MKVTREPVDHRGQPHWRYAYVVTMRDGSVVRCPGPYVRMTNVEKREHRKSAYAALSKQIAADLAGREEDGRIIQRINP